MPWFEDQADLFLVGAEVTSDPIADLGRKLPAWDLVENLVAELNVSAAAVDAGDSLVVQYAMDHNIGDLGEAAQRMQQDQVAQRSATPPTETRKAYRKFAQDLKGYGLKRAVMSHHPHLAPY
jgi:hypothetical protein